MKLEGLKLWQERSLFCDEGVAAYGCKGFVSGVFRNGCIDCDMSSLSAYNKDFQQEFSLLVRFLQSEEAECFLRDLDSLTKYCRERFYNHIPYHFNREYWGFRVMAERNVWYIGCTPWNDKRHFTVYCYDRDTLMRTLAEERGLPSECYGILPFTGELIYIRFAEQGFEVLPQSSGDICTNKDIAATQNSLIGVGLAQVSAMENGVIYGWDTPVADPRNYDCNGHWYIPPQQNREGKRKWISQ